MANDESLVSPSVAKWTTKPSSENTIKQSRRSFKVKNLKNKNKVKYKNLLIVSQLLVQMQMD